MNPFIVASSCASANQKKHVKNSSSSKKTTRFVSLFLLSALIGMAGILYIFKVNEIATMGYDIKQKEELIAKIKEENKQLEIATAQHRAIYHFEDEKDKLDMKKPDIVGFIEIEVEEAVAMNEAVVENRN
jgi:hypothetical protein